jgi:hypothetical protein
MKLFITALALAALCVACTTTNPDTGERVYDPIRTEQVKASLSPLVTGGVRATIANNPRHRDELGTYYRSIGTVFCRMVDTRQFSPSYLIDEVNKITAPQIASADPLLLTARDSALALYRIFYAEKGRAELTEASWALHLADLFCLSIDTALRDSGLAGVRP